MKRVLITGAAGFSGRYMCEYLAGLDEKLDLTGTDIVGPRNTCCDKFVVTDLSSVKAVEDLVRQTNPDYIIHLAGTFGTDNSQIIYEVNVLSITALLEAARKYIPNVVMVAAGSAAEYGCIEPPQLPVDEQTPCQPVTLYGLSKHFATQTALYYHRVHNICTMIIRPFQLIGKGVTSRLVPGAFAEQLKQTIAEGSTVIKVGNLRSSRDFLDVRDAVKAIWTLCQKPACGQIFNLCSGKTTKIAELLQLMIEHCGVEVKIEVDPSRLRGNADVSNVYGSCRKIKDHCGWSPKISLRESISEMFTK